MVEVVSADPIGEDIREYVVLVNQEGQCSLWPASSPIPDGWKAIGSPRNRASCLAWIDEHWTDIRPLSLIRQMDDARTRR